MFKLTIKCTKKLQLNMQPKKLPLITLKIQLKILFLRVWSKFPYISCMDYCNNLNCIYYSRIMLVPCNTFILIYPVALNLWFHKKACIIFKLTSVENCTWNWQLPPLNIMREPLCQVGNVLKFYFYSRSV